MIARTENSFTLPKNTVHLWHARFDDAALDLMALNDLLSQDEVEKAGRFRFEKEKKQSVISRGALRWLLGRYLHVPPTDLVFGYTEHGKPLLQNDSSLRFNVSHSGDRAIFAFVQESELGVDIEKIKSDFDVLNIAKHFFSADEIQTLEALPEQDRPAGFFRCWTRKESFIKAKGSGLSFPLNSFSVSLDADRAELLRTDWDASERKEWQLATFWPSEGYLAALSVRGVVDTVFEQDWNMHYAASQ